MRISCDASSAAKKTAQMKAQRHLNYTFKIKNVIYKYTEEEKGCMKDNVPEFLFFSRRGQRSESAKRERTHTRNATGGGNQTFLTINSV
jgi:hypothetical protein